jgi:hypothetical protein
MNLTKRSVGGKREKERVTEQINEPILVLPQQVFTARVAAQPRIQWTFHAVVRRLVCRKIMWY